MIKIMPNESVEINGGLVRNCGPKPIYVLTGKKVQKGSDMKIKMNWNFLFARYVMIENKIDDDNFILMEGLILQWPTWDLKSAICKGKFLGRTIEETN